MNLKDLYREGAELLKLSGVFEYELDAKILLLYVFDISLQDFILDGSRVLVQGDDKKIIKYKELIIKRAKRIPLQYLTNKQSFYGLDFYVNSDVLIPRYDTEVLVEKILKENKNSDLNVLDMCTGSGCIAVTLKKVAAFNKVYALDISKRALEVANKNAIKHGVDIELIESDMFEKIAYLKDKLDIIVSNPPYIKSQDIRELMPEVREYEPILALDGDEDGFKFYRVIAAMARDFLKKDGKIYLEIGHDQARDIVKIFAEHGISNIDVTKDLAGQDRVISAYL